MPDCSSHPVWVDQYVAIPYLPDGRDKHGCDCWGLVRMVYANQFGIDLADRADEADLVHTDRWVEVYPSMQELGDILMFSSGAFKRHVGVCLDRTWMLHANTNMNSVVERYDTVLWKSRLKRIYRYGERN